jgi:hypothetical protein
MTATRRLAAILAADVAGYSRLIETDEEGTLERLKALRRELLDPKIATHRGRIVNRRWVARRVRQRPRRAQMRLRANLSIWKWRSRFNSEPVAAIYAGRPPMLR